MGVTKKIKGKSPFNGVDTLLQVPQEMSRLDTENMVKTPNSKLEETIQPIYSAVPPEVTVDSRPKSRVQSIDIRKTY